MRISIHYEYSWEAMGLGQARGPQFLPPEPVSLIHLWPGETEGLTCSHRTRFPCPNQGSKGTAGRVPVCKRWRREGERSATGPPRTGLHFASGRLQLREATRGTGVHSQTALGEFSTVSKNQPARSPGARTTKPCTWEARLQSVESTGDLLPVSSHPKERPTAGYQLAAH